MAFQIKAIDAFAIFLGAAFFGVMGRIIWSLFTGR